MSSVRRSLSSTAHAPLVALPVALSLTACDYVRLLRPKVLTQLNPRVLRLVFVGEPMGEFDVLDARTGELLWEVQTGSGIHSSPITYSAGGKQYVAVGARRVDEGLRAGDVPRPARQRVARVRTAVSRSPRARTRSATSA